MQDLRGGAAGRSEAWYLFGAWLLAATMNAMLTWWGVSLAVLSHETLGNAVVSRGTLLRVVPIFVAVLVWLIRVLIIGTFSVAGERLFSQGDQPLQARTRTYPRVSTRARPAPSLGSHTQAARSASASPKTNRTTRRPVNHPAPNPNRVEAEYDRSEPTYSRPELTYHPLSASAPPGLKGANPSGTDSISRRSGSQFR